MCEKLEVDLSYIKTLNINIGIPQSGSLKAEIYIVLLYVTIEMIFRQRDLTLFVLIAFYLEWVNKDFRLNVAYVKIKVAIFYKRVLSLNWTIYVYNNNYNIISKFVQFFRLSKLSRKTS